MNKTVIACLAVIAFFGDASHADPRGIGSCEATATGSQTDLEPLKVSLANRWGGVRPHEWGVSVSGVATRLCTSGNDLALVFHACGGSYDAAIIDLLERERIPATIFISGPWLKAHPDIALRLTANPLFEIANHGLRHRPLSVTGRSAYGIQGARNVEEVVDEVEGGARAIQAVTGRRPDLFCPGTAYADEVAIEVVKALGYVPVSFTVNGDAGATSSQAQIVDSLNNAPRGSLVLLHMNRPEGWTAEALATALPTLKDRGVRFVKLSRCSFFLSGAAVRPSSRHK